MWRRSLLPVVASVILVLLGVTLFASQPSRKKLLVDRSLRSVPYYEEEGVSVSFPTDNSFECHEGFIAKEAIDFNDCYAKCRDDDSESECSSLQYTWKEDPSHCMSFWTTSMPPLELSPELSGLTPLPSVQCIHTSILAVDHAYDLKCQKIYIAKEAISSSPEECIKSCEEDDCIGFMYDYASNGCSLYSDKGYQNQPNLWQGQFCYKVWDEAPTPLPSSLPSISPTPDSSFSDIVPLECPCFNENDLYNAVSGIEKDDYNLEEVKCAIQEEVYFTYQSSIEDLSSTGTFGFGVTRGSCTNSTSTLYGLDRAQSEACFSLLEDVCDRLLVRAECPCFSSRDLSSALKAVEYGSMKLVDYECTDPQSSYISMQHGMLPDLPHFSPMTYGVWKDSCIEYDMVIETTPLQSSSCSEIMEEACDTVKELYECPCFSEKTLDSVMSRIELGGFRLLDYNCNSTLGGLEFSYQNSRLPEFVDFGHAFGIYDEKACLRDDMMQPTTASQAATCLELMEGVCEDIIEMEVSIIEEPIDKDCPCYTVPGIDSLMSNAASGLWNITGYDCDNEDRIISVSYQKERYVRIPLPGTVPTHTIGLDTMGVVDNRHWCIEDDMRLSLNEEQLITCSKLMDYVCSTLTSGGNETSN